MSSNGSDDEDALLEVDANQPAMPAFPAAFGSRDSICALVGAPIFLPSPATRLPPCPVLDDIGRAAPEENFAVVSVGTIYEEPILLTWPFLLT